MIIEALREHQEGAWPSPYKAQVKKIIDQYGLHFLTSNSSLAKISESTWAALLEEKYRMKSLRFFSVRNDRWELPSHITDGKESKMLSRFRVGNAGLGNRAPIHGLKESIKECPLCIVSGHHFPLNEIHVVFECSTLVAV